MMEYPPLPKGAKFVNDLPPLPKGARFADEPQGKVTIGELEEPSYQKSLAEEQKKIASGETYVDPMGGVYSESLAPAGAVAGNLATGVLKPIAGALELGNIREPAKRVKQLQREFEMIGGTPAEVAGLFGEIGSPLPTKAMNLPMVGKALQKLPETLQKSKLAQYGAMGATMGLLEPQGMSDEDYMTLLSKKLESAGTSGVLGAGLGKAGQMLMNPQVSEKVKMLKDMGVKNLTPGQLASQIPFLGKMLQNTEAKATSLPIVGDIIRANLNATNRSFNKGLGNEVLSKMGEKLPKDVPAGAPMVEYLNNRIENAYDSITPLLQLQNMRYKNPTSPTGFTTTVKALSDKVADITSTLPSAHGNDLAGMVKHEFDKWILAPLAKMSMGKVMSGEEFRNAEKNLGEVALKYMRNPATYDVGVALRELQAELRNELAYQNPKIAEKLRGLHQAFIAHLPIERAASMVGAHERVFSPNQFESAIKVFDKSKNKGRFASGKTQFYPESEAALSVMGQKIPDSGTAGRLGTISMISSGLYEPMIPLVPAITTGSVYNPLSIRALNTLATGQRPEMVRKLQPEVSGALARSASPLQKD